MTRKNIFKSALIVAAASLFTLAACKKDSSSTSNATPANADDNGGYASDGAKMEQANNETISIADLAAASGGSNLRTAGTTISPCASVTNDTTVTPHVLTINFGTTDCTCADAKNRRGEIIVTYTGHYKDSGSTHTISYSNYFVNDNQITGNKTVTNMGTNSAGQYYYNVTINDSMIIASDSVITWTGNRVRTWLDGYGSISILDDVYQVTGTTTLTRANGHSFTFDITTPLYVAVDCPYIEAGVVSITGSTLSSARTLNYGTAGHCDSEAQLTIDGITYNITLH